MLKDEIRRAVYERDGRCLVCGKFVTYESMHPHHIQTRGSGGGDTEDNLICLCGRCHDRVHYSYLTLDGEEYEVTSGVLRALLLLVHGIDAGPETQEIATAEKLLARYSLEVGWVF
jgi:hypothetical protein